MQYHMALSASPPQPRRAHPDLNAISWTSLPIQLVYSTAQAQKRRHQWSNYTMDLVDMRAARAVALAAGQMDFARVLFESSPEGIAFRDKGKEAISGFEAHVEAVRKFMLRWEMECTLELSSALLMMRGLGTLLLPDGDPAVAAALEWLPPPAALLALADAEKAWDVFMNGRQHPTLLCALLYARVARWEVAAEIAEGLTQRLQQPLTRIEAWQLLARARAALTGPSDAHAPLLSAIAEAKAVGYLWLELLATRDLYRVGGCAPSCVDQVAHIECNPCSL